MRVGRGVSLVEAIVLLIVRQTKASEKISSLEAELQKLWRSVHKYSHLYDFAPVGCFTLDKEEPSSTLI
jgi:hypothetical protein